MPTKRKMGLFAISKIVLGAINHSDVVTDGLPQYVVEPVHWFAGITGDAVDEIALKSAEFRGPHVRNGRFNEFVGYPVCWPPAVRCVGHYSVSHIGAVLSARYSAQPSSANAGGEHFAGFATNGDWP